MTENELQAIAAEPYEHRGILHSEMALIIYTCRKLGVEVVLESGRARGQSTYMLAKYLPDVDIHSIEMRQDADAAFGIERCQHFPNVALYLGNGQSGLPALADKVAPRKTAVLCDGPKGIAAVGVIEKCFRRPHVVVGFIHDMRRLDHGQPSPFRAAAEAVFPRAGFSDEPALVAAASWMDAKVVEANGPVGPAHEQEYGSYGPTVGVFVNRQNAGAAGL